MWGLSFLVLYSALAIPLFPSHQVEHLTGGQALYSFGNCVLRNADFSSSFQNDKTDGSLTCFTKTKASDTGKRDQKQG